MKFLKGGGGWNRGKSMIFYHIFVQAASGLHHR